MTKGQSPKLAATRWELIPKAADRLGVHPGHLRRLCKERLQHDGRARLIHGGGKRSRWQVRIDANDLHDLIPAVFTHSPGDSITIEVMRNGTPCFRMTIPATGGDRREAVEVPSKAIRRKK